MKTWYRHNEMPLLIDGQAAGHEDCCCGEQQPGPADCQCDATGTITISYEGDDCDWYENEYGSFPALPPLCKNLHVEDVSSPLVSGLSFDAKKDDPFKEFPLNGWQVYIFCQTDTWGATAEAFGNLITMGCRGYNSNISGLQCINGKLRGSFEIPIDQWYDLVGPDPDDIGWLPCGTMYVTISD